MTAADLAALWEPLFAKCPELRPNVVIYDGPAERYWLHSRHWEGSENDKDSWWWADEKGQFGISREIVDPEMAAALIRDSAVRWLLNRDAVRIDESGVSMPLGGRRDEWVTWSAGTLDRSLAFAVGECLTATSPTGAAPSRTTAR